MAFPVSPTNGQTAVVNNITYQFSNVGNTWTRILSTANIITANTVVSNGLISAVGNVVGNYILGNGSQLTGISINPSNIASGTSNVQIVSAGGNATVNIGGTSNVAVFATTGEYITGVLSASGNVTGGNILTAGAISATGTLSVSGNTTVANVSAGNISAGSLNTSGLISATANVVGGNILTSGIVSAAGNGVIAGRQLTVGGTYTSYTSATRGLVAINGASDAILDFANGVSSHGYLYHSGTAMSLYNLRAGDLTFATSGIARLSISSAGIVSATGNIQGGNIRTAGLISATGTISSAANIGTSGGNILAAGYISATGNMLGGNLRTAGLISATGNVTGGNLLTAGLISATGAITNGDAVNFNTLAQNISIGTSQTTGTTTIGGPAQTGNILIGQSTATQILNIGTGATSSANTKSINLAANGVVDSTSNVTIFSGVAGNSTLTIGANAGNTTVSYTGNTIVAIANTSGSALSVAGNITGGNILNNGLISSTGNSTAANYLTSGLVSATANITGGNVLTAGQVSATGNITGSNILTAGLISATSTITSAANVTGGNVLTGGLVSATANVTGGNILTAGIISATGNITGGNANITGTTAATSKTTGALVVGGGIGVASDVWAGNSVTVDGGVYGNVVATQFASLYATGAGANPYSIVQVRSNDGTTGMGMQAYANLNGLVYSNTGITFQTGATIRDKDYPTGGATRVTIDSTGLVANGIVSASGNVTGGNILTAGQISATGNITGNYYIGNGAFLTGLSAGTADQIANGATSISIPVSSGNISMSVTGQANTVVINLGSLTMYGTFAGPKTLSANVSVADAVNALLMGPVTIGAGYHIDVPATSTLYVYAP